MFAIQQKLQNVLKIINLFLLMKFNNKKKSIKIYFELQYKVYSVRNVIKRYEILHSLLVLFHIDLVGNLFIFTSDHYSLC